MAPYNNLKLFLTSLLISFISAQSQLSPDVFPSQPSYSSPPILSPSQGPASGPASVPSPSPAADAPLNHVPFPPSISDPPSESISPTAEPPAEPDSPFQFVLSSLFAPSDEVNPKLKEICESTDHPSLCIATISPFLNGKIDVPSVLDVAIKVAEKLSNYALSLAKKFAERPGIPPQIASVLEDCKESYDTAVYNFESAKEAFPKRDIGRMNSVLSAVITDVGDCEDAFAGVGEESPLSRIADRLTNMTSNCLAIISLLD